MNKPSYDTITALNYLLAFNKPVKKLKYDEENIPIPTEPTIGEITANLLHIIIQAYKPKRILDLGTSWGFSAICMGRSAKSYGGKVISIDKRNEIIEYARKNIIEEGLEDTIEIIEGDTSQIIRDIKSHFDLILQDGYKFNYFSELDILVKKLKNGGLLFSDDVLFPVMGNLKGASKYANAMDEYNNILLYHPQLKTVWLPIEDGIAISVKEK